MTESVSAPDVSASDWELPETFDFHGQRVRYGVLGDGPPLVLLHGTPFSSVVWRRIAPELARHRRVHYFDLLGYGRSEQRTGQDVSLGVQNALFAELLGHWDLDRPDVVAHDFGGATALRTHLLDGRDYRTLTLIDPVAIGPSGSALIQATRRHADVFAGLPGYLHEALLRTYIDGAAYRSLSTVDMERYLRPWLGERGQAAFYRQIAQMDDRYTDQVEPGYGRIRCPVSILWGERDEWIPVAKGRTLAARIPGAAFRVIPEAGHLVPEDAPEAVVGTVLDFLRASRTPADPAPHG